VRGRAFAVALAVAAGFGMLTGCTTVETCVSWVDYETAQDAFDDTALVVVGTATPTGGTRNVFGTDVPVYAIDVDETLKGSAPDRLEVTPTPLTCMGDGVSEFVDGVDPLATSDELILFLYDDEGSWRTITPFDGVLPLRGDGTLPFEVPDR
jgi:hypothetical protein